VERILENIGIWETSNDNPITVFLARIIDRTTVSTQPFSYNNPNVDEFNIKISELIDSRTANGDKIIEVDQHAAIDDPVNDLMIDGIHPVPSAYEKMADKWLEAIVASNVIPVCQKAPN
jgi:lysophospholipase L1-like esterase